LRDAADYELGRMHEVSRNDPVREAVVPEKALPQVLLRGPGQGDRITLPMDGLEAQIVRKASRTETDGHWAIGEAWQEPGFDNPPHVHDEAEAFYVLEGEYTFYTDADPAEGIGPGTFVFIPPGAVHGFRTGPAGGRLLCVWPSTVEAAFFGRPH
jgi:quercetin dioxygenase-like cupin family protein